MKNLFLDWKDLVTDPFFVSQNEAQLRALILFINLEGWIRSNKISFNKDGRESLPSGFPYDLYKYRHQWDLA